MTGDHLVKPPKKLMGEIEGLEEILRHGYMPIDRYEKLRPMTARLLVPKAQDPRIPRVSPRGALSAREGSVPASSSPRRKLSSIAAYRKAGIDPTYSLLPSTTEPPAAFVPIPSGASGAGESVRVFVGTS